MKFEIIWSAFAESQLEDIFEYYIENASLKVAKNIIQQIIIEPNRIVQNPEISQIEELLIDRKESYRYLICKNHKIIYSIDFKLKQIKIADVFDSRQNPTKIKRNE